MVLSSKTYQDARGNASSGTPSTWLLGTWRSDKDATIAAWGRQAPGSKKFQAFLLEGLGKLAQRYTAKQCYAEYEGGGSSAPYRVLWENKDSLLLVYGTKADERGMLITFTSPNQYWLHAGRYVEYFSKMNDGSRVDRHK